jgi:hypothetical protein
MLTATAQTDSCTTIVWCTGDISIEIKPMEANSEKTPMIAAACELRGIDFQNLFSAG